MMMDEGYIKFNCKWIKADAVSKDKISEINHWRNKLYTLGLIGAYDNGIGFGNLSRCLDENSFLITGSATGGLDKLNESHFALVTDYNIEKNELTCEGPIKASSESLSHAIIYECSPETNAVIHVHNGTMWKKFIHHVPTTKSDVAYGTPEMAKEITRLFKETNVKEEKFLVMGGHQEGIIAFGNTIDEAGAILLEKYFV